MHDTLLLINIEVDTKINKSNNKEIIVNIHVNKILW